MHFWRPFSPPNVRASEVLVTSQTLSTQAIVDHLGMASESLLFIDDHQSNVDAARESGLQAERFHVDEGFEKLKGVLEHYGTLDS